MSNEGSHDAAGGPVPQGADAVIQIEDTEAAPDQGGRRYVKLKRGAKPGEDIRPVRIKCAPQVVGQCKAILCTGSGPEADA